MNEPTYTLRIGPDAPLYEQALRELEKRCKEYLRLDLQTDADLAAKINEFHVELIEHPRGHH